MKRLLEILLNTSFRYSFADLFPLKYFIFIWLVTPPRFKVLGVASKQRLATSIKNGDTFSVTIQNGFSAALFYLEYGRGFLVINAMGNITTLGETSIITVSGTTDKINLTATGNSSYGLLYKTLW